MLAMYLAVFVLSSSPGLMEGDLKRLERHYPKTLEKIEDNRPLSIQDIKNLTRAGVADAVIIHEISTTRSIFYLSPEEEQELKQAGVSHAVINHMKNTSDYTQAK